MNLHETFQKATALISNGFYVGIRDPKRNTIFNGKYMVAETHLPYETKDASVGGYCTVGDDLTLLVNEAYDELFA